MAPVMCVAMVAVRVPPGGSVSVVFPTAWFGPQWFSGRWRIFRRVTWVGCLSSRREPDFLNRLHGPAVSVGRNGEAAWNEVQPYTIEKRKCHVGRARRRASAAPFVGEAARYEDFVYSVH